MMIWPPTGVANRNDKTSKASIPNSTDGKKLWTPGILQTRAEKED